MNNYQIATFQLRWVIMSDWLQWGITAIIGLLGVFIGRVWASQDRKRGNDREVFEKIKKILPSNGSIEYIRDHDFGGIYRVSKLDQLDDYISEMVKPDYFFVDRKMESCRLELLENVKAFYIRLGLEAFPLREGNIDMNCIPKEHEFDDRTRYHKIREELNSLASKVCKSYDKFVKFSKERL